MAIRYKIHPGIGFARVGTSDATYLQSEIPGIHPAPANGRYRDASGKLKRQASRFWVFRYGDNDDANTAQPVSIGSDDVARVEWRVHLVNAKAAWFNFEGITGEGPAGYPPGHPLRNPTATDRRSLVIDPGPRAVTADGGSNSHEISKGTSGNPAIERWPPAFSVGGSIDSLGTLTVDAQGRLSVAGGYGKSGSVVPPPANGFLNYDNNDNWFDDVSDGPVSARIVLTNGQSFDAVPAWVVVAPPDYAPPIQNIVTVYDLLYDLALRSFALDPTIYDPQAQTFNNGFQPSFTEHIFPVLWRALEYRFVIADAAPHESGGLFSIVNLAAPAPAGEDPQNNDRFRVFRRLRDPDNLMGPGNRNMPKLHNDGTDGAPPETRRFTLTRFQFHCMRQWAAGVFISDWAGVPPTPAATVTAQRLDRAALEAACGGAFFPGMESGWILRDPRVYSTPFDFRFRHASEPDGMIPGSATKRMALPWQADFLKCASYWWPAQRPNQVFGPANPEWDRGIQSHTHLVEAWSQLGIVAPDPNAPGSYIETERTLPEPP